MRALPLLLLFALPALATEYVGQLKGDPVPDPLSLTRMGLVPAPREVLPAPPAAEDKVFAGSWMAG